MKPQLKISDVGYCEQKICLVCRIQFRPVQTKKSGKNRFLKKKNSIGVSANFNQNLCNFFWQGCQYCILFVQNKVLYLKKIEKKLKIRSISGLQAKRLRAFSKSFTQGLSKRAQRNILRFFQRKDDLVHPRFADSG